jgi:hypothetical protein
MLHNKYTTRFVLEPFPYTSNCDFVPLTKYRIRNLQLKVNMKKQIVRNGGNTRYVLFFPQTPNGERAPGSLKNISFYLDFFF